MHHVRARPISRRGLLTAGGAAGLTALLAACGDDAGSGGGDAKGGPWSFEDDRGETARADGTPRTIVAFTGTAAALHDYGIECAGVFGPTRTADGKPDVQAGDLDVDAVEILGNTWGQFSVEKYAALGPELIVAPTFDDAGTLWYVPEESADKILQLAPSVAVSVYDRPMTGPLERMLELAGSLGADTGSAEIRAARKRFEDAAGRLRQAAKSRKDIRVLVGSGSADLFYVSGTNLSADLEYFKQLGVNFVEPPEGAKENSGGWFEELSWENVDKYDADLIMLDNRTSTLQQSALADKPTWGRLPAVEAGQVVSRVTEPVYSYDKCAPVLDDLAEALENARKVS
ncbi:ABC transporter substrate-binding protein [Streptomyces sp. WMMC500]|uniref:ABC transporter substrate-binding protein n=1 Tax=Streptomyces sp. WMMC500 TaxID=3015154 RepID=UPI00248C4831|nr:ABC transporter substrate-binding protein [Streptomyces sp. WMMC500]WBB59189.1 ABC transporter substrate-binding protein [Streptomyces sp. WMMC500]